MIFVDCLFKLEGFIKEQIDIYAERLYTGDDEALDKLYKLTFILSSLDSLDVKNVTRGLADKIYSIMEDVDINQKFNLVGSPHLGYPIFCMWGEFGGLFFW